MAERGKFKHIRKRQKGLAFLRLIRFPNLTMIFLGQLLVGLVILDTPWWREWDSTIQFFMLQVSTILVAAGGYIINDYYDVKIDVVNKPNRVVVGKVISRRQTLLAHFMINAFGLFAAWFTNQKTFSVVVFAIFWLWLYSNRLKRLPLIGNVSVSAITALALYLPSMVFPPANPSLVIFCLFSFWISLIREIVKDMEDMKGDAKHGCRTLPIAYGLPRTKFILYIIGGLFSLTFFVAAFWLPLIWVGFAIVLGGVLFLFFQDLAKADTRKHFAGLSQWCKWMMLAGILSMLTL